MSDNLVGHIRAIIKWVETGEPQARLDIQALEGDLFPLLGQAADEIERQHCQLVTARQHIGWLKGYCETMTEANWADMRLSIRRQAAELSALLTDDQDNK